MMKRPLLSLPRVSRVSLMARTQSIRGRYHQISNNKPYLTSMVTGGSILTLSDLTAQCVSSRFIDDYRFDLRRTLALCTFGTFYYGLVCRKLYFVYGSLFGPGRAMLKASIECGVHTPFLFIPCFYGITGTIKGQRPTDIYEQLKTEWWTSAPATMAYWYPMMWINFKYCTPETRILFISSMSLIHKSALSWYSNRTRVQLRTLEAARDCELSTEYGIEEQPNSQLSSKGKDIRMDPLSRERVLECPLWSLDDLRPQSQS